MAIRSSIIVMFLLAIILAGGSFKPTAAAMDAWTVVVENAGVEAMHMTFYTDKVAIFDRTNLPSNSSILLPNGRCRDNPKDLASKHDCYAHSVEYDSLTDTIRPLFIFSDPFCSSGAFLPDGTLQQTGGDKDGAWTIRTLGAGSLDDWWRTRTTSSSAAGTPSPKFSPTAESSSSAARNNPLTNSCPRRAPMPSRCRSSRKLTRPRQRAKTTSTRSCTSSPTATSSSSPTSTRLSSTTTRTRLSRPLQTSDPTPVLPLFRYLCDAAPHSGGRLQHSHHPHLWGQELGAYGFNKRRWTISAKTRALDTCGRIEVTAAAPQWIVEKMPGPRVMVDGMILPTGEILLVNGMQYGVSGWHTTRNPALAPYLYDPTTRVFTVQTPTTIVRPYHSSANVQSDGTVLIAGGNDQGPYVFTGVMFPTELLIEKYYPYYLNAAYDPVRYSIVTIPATVKWNVNFKVKFQSPSWPTPPAAVNVSVYAPSYTTHANSMNQRMVVLKQVENITYGRKGTWDVHVTASPNGNIAPPGYYMLTALNAATAPAIPSKAKWIKFTP